MRPIYRWLILFAIVALLVDLGLAYHFLQALPSAPDPAHGYIYPLKNGATMLYASRREIAVMIVMQLLVAVPLLAVAVASLIDRR
ncbi:MAG TPA: hypothetical protein VL574_07410 [Stellaceae bacterium]|jgi:hypothetical protein|nr:hypothetical protein [Stellaceae bacterium]